MINEFGCVHACSSIVTTFYSIDWRQSALVILVILKMVFNFGRVCWGSALQSWGDIAHCNCQTRGSNCCAVLRLGATVV